MTCHPGLTSDLGIGVDTAVWGWPDVAAGAWHRGGSGEIVLIRKLPAASAGHPSPGQSRSTAVSAGNDKLVDRGQGNSFTLVQKNIIIHIVSNKLLGCKSRWGGG